MHCIAALKEENMNFNKICYYVSLFILILGLVMAVGSLVVVLPSFTMESAIIPGAFVLLAVVGFAFMRYYKKKM